MAVADVPTLLTGLLACLCAALEDSVGGPVCRCCLHPGAGPVPADTCCDCDGDSMGQASLRVARIFPAKAPFPTQATSDRDLRCGHSLAVEVELTVYRCVGVLDDAGNPPTCERLTADALMLIDDARAMREAVLCCFADTDTALIMGAWVPTGPSGGCAGGTITVTVEVEGDCCDE